MLALFLTLAVAKDHYPTTGYELQQALDTAESGDVIWLDNRMFVGSFTASNADLAIVGPGTLTSSTGVTFTAQTDLVFQELTFDGGGTGRGLAVQSGATVHLDRVDFTAHSTVAEGGTVQHHGTLLSAKHLTITDSGAAGGGCMLLEGETELYSSSITNCDSTADGGALLTRNTTTSVYGTIIGDSAAVGLGGLIKSEGAQLTLIDSELHTGSADSGGGLALVNSTATILNACIRDSDAVNGGAVHSANGTSDWFNAWFLRNSAGTGAAFYHGLTTDAVHMNQVTMDGNFGSVDGSATHTGLLGSLTGSNLVLVNHVGPTMVSALGSAQLDQVLTFNNGGLPTAGAAALSNEVALNPALDADLCRPESASIYGAENPDLDDDGYTTEDCAPNDPLVHPGAMQLCLGDQDCDGLIGEEDPDWDRASGIIYYLDADGDGEGDPDQTAHACTSPGAGWVTNGDDCDDTNNLANTGAYEICDGIDNDCDGLTDGADPNLSDTDADGDGVGDCEGDCDDDDPDRFPGNAEICDEIDNNCDGLLPVDEQDIDGDGFLACLDDCNDSVPSRYPGAPELCNGIDDDCDDIIPSNEIDGDDDGSWLCDPEPDCDDTDPYIYPTAAELCDGIDNSCQGLDPGEFDLDGDGFRGCQDDCDDSNADVFPGQLEVCNGIDDDCVSGVDDPFPTEVAYADGDGDGYGLKGTPPETVCVGREGYAPNNDDCDDTDPLVRPDQIESCETPYDDNCVDGTEDSNFLPIWPDLDGDSYGDPLQASTLSCGFPGIQESFSNDDCDDADPAISPGATEVCDGIDNNCDGATDEGVLSTRYPDLDGDGFGGPTSVQGCADAGEELGDDCDDDDSTVSPAALEECDGIDNNCDGTVDEDCTTPTTDTGPITPPTDTGTLSTDTDPDTGPLDTEPPKAGERAAAAAGCGCQTGALTGWSLGWMLRRR